MNTVTMLEMSRIVGINSSELLKKAAKDPSFPKVIGRHNKGDFYYDQQAFETWYANNPTYRLDSFLVQRFLARPLPRLA